MEYCHKRKKKGGEMHVRATDVISLIQHELGAPPTAGRSTGQDHRERLRRLWLGRLLRIFWFLAPFRILLLLNYACKNFINYSLNFWLAGTAHSTFEFFELIGRATHPDTHRHIYVYEGHLSACPVPVVEQQDRTD